MKNWKTITNWRTCGKKTCIVAGDLEIYKQFQRNIKFCKVDMWALPRLA